MIIYPEQKTGLVWGICKTIIIFISLFTLSYSAAFIFKFQDHMLNYEMFFDIIQLTDIIITCFTAQRSRDISDATRQLFITDNKDEDQKVQVAIKFESEWEVNLKLITTEYLRTNFVFDFLASVPCLLTGEKVLYLYAFKIFRVIRLFRIITFL